MLTTQNYFDKTANLNWNTLPEPLQKGHSITQSASLNNWKLYNSNENIHRVIDTYLSKLSEYLEKNAPVEAPKKKATTKAKPTVEKPKKEQAPAAPKPAKKEKKEASQTPVTEVNKVDAEVRLIKRYAAMHGKIKTADQVLGLLKSLQRAILDKIIRLSSPFAEEINHIQEQLILLYERMEKSAQIEIEKEKLIHYQAIGSSQKVLRSILFLKAFLKFQGQSKDLNRIDAMNLATKIKKAVENKQITPSDPYRTQLEAAYKSLVEFASKQSSKVPFNQAELRGLLGGFEESNQAYSNNPTGIVSSEELLGMEFETIGLTGKFRKVIGDPSPGFTCMVYGLPKNGKSYWCIEFALHLAKYHGKVLYCAIEEGIGKTLQKKIDEIGAKHPNLYFTNKLPENIQEFDFVFIDSATKANIEIQDIEALRRTSPHTSIIYIYQTTKEGNFRGGNAHAHEVDVIVEIKNQKAEGRGRFG